jgi:uncharacterized protein (DUF849 family)
VIAVGAAAGVDVRVGLEGLLVVFGGRVAAGIAGCSGRTWSWWGISIATMEYRLGR